jgi:hypothetical protein
MTVIVMARSNLPDQLTKSHGQKNIVVDPEGPGTKNDCAGRDEQ